jgi:hypothetical protein
VNTSISPLSISTGTRDDDLSFRLGEDAPDAGVEIEDARGAVELLEHRGEDGAVFGHRGTL